MTPRALIPWFPGTNCHWEMKRAFELAGARAEIVLHGDLARSKKRLFDCDLLGFAGGFSFGDHFGAGRLAALELRNLLLDQLLEVEQRKIPILGICNGFQILVEAGLLPGKNKRDTPTAVLDLNSSARFEHWRNAQIYIHEQRGVDSVWIKGLDGMPLILPVANAEGRFVSLGSSDAHVIATYGSKRGEIVYPRSPSGSRIAAVQNEDGRIAGFMPHPERRVCKLYGGDEGLLIFKAGVEAVK